MKNSDEIVKDIRSILDSSLPSGAWKEVSKFKGFGEGIKIAFAASDIDINNVRGQKPQCVSLCLWTDYKELSVQGFGGNGGNRIYIEPDEGSYLAMQGVKISFRKPKYDEKAIYSAIERFCKRWIQALNDNIDRLTNKDLVNYSELLKS